MQGLKLIDRNIAAVRRTGDKFNQLVHETAMAIARHAMEHGDCSRAQVLLHAMPASMRRTQLALWFHTYTPIVVKEKEPGWNSKMHKEGSKLFVPFDLDAGDAMPWYKLAEANAEGETKTLTFEQLVEMISGVAKRIEKKADDGAIEEGSIDAARNIARTLRALKFDKPVANNDEAAPVAPLAAVG